MLRFLWPNGEQLTITIPPAWVEAVSQRAAVIAASGTAQRTWFDAHAAAEYLCTTPDAIRAMVKRGQLVPTRRKPHYLFSRDELDRWAHSE